MKKATIRKPPLDFGGETLGQRLTRLRNQRGYTQVEFAKKVGITQVLVSSYETDRRQFSVHSLRPGPRYQHRWTAASQGQESL